MIKQYCIYTKDFRKVPGFFSQLQDRSIPFEAHINRTRFWLNSSLLDHRQFYLQYMDYMTCVDRETDHTSGT